MFRSPFAFLLLCLARAQAAQAAELLVYLLAGQSNMEGQAEVATRNRTTGAYLNGTLAYQLTDPRTAAAFSPLWDAATQNWTVWEGVKVWYNECPGVTGQNGSAIPSSPGQATFGSLSVGFGWEGQGNLIGPELGFGYGMQLAAPGQPLLIVKTAWGGKTLAGDFRPPSSAASPDAFCTTPACAAVGHYYSVMVQAMHKMLAPGAIGAMFPSLAGLTPRLAGFGWFQGYNDGCDLNQTAAYESNLVNLVKDLRAEFASPALPFAIPVAGFNGFNGAERTRHPASATPWVDMAPADKIGTDCTVDHGCRRLDIVLSQFAAANATRHPELGGHVAAMETRGFWRDPLYSPNQAQGYHYWHNAETYFLVGKAMAEGMLLAAAV